MPKSGSRFSDTNMLPVVAAKTPKTVQISPLAA